LNARFFFGILFFDLALDLFFNDTWLISKNGTGLSLEGIQSFNLSELSLFIDLGFGRRAVFNRNQEPWLDIAILLLVITDFFNDFVLETAIVEKTAWVVHSHVVNVDFWRLIDLAHGLWGNLGPLDKEIPFVAVASVEELAVLVGLRNNDNQVHVNNEGEHADQHPSKGFTLGTVGVSEARAA